ncbi:hypothetical protein [Fuchsiella alkaliacetigena]|uniref:hypothetical protein n=1 Tax=Fuchsiella alkaliacetigena TaxID=957042 RepID=UPI002009F75D|nr:hypothetical protein [Fuchsiella alkaliacetigena]MCK8824077.1 hypothetical protein [Fuchsiella alkaliacetigena]
MKVRNEVPIEEINDFILNLPEDKRDSWAEVTEILKEEGLISMEDDFSTIDDEMLDAQVEENRRI